MITPYKQNVIDSFIVLQHHYLHSEGPRCPKKRQEIYSKFGKDSVAWFEPFLAVKWLDTLEWRWQKTKSGGPWNNLFLITRQGQYHDWKDAQCNLVSVIYSEISVHVHNVTQFLGLFSLQNYMINVNRTNSRGTFSNLRSYKQDLFQPSLFHFFSWGDFQAWPRLKRMSWGLDKTTRALVGQNVKYAATCW